MGEAERERQRERESEREILNILNILNIRNVINEFQLATVHTIIILYIAQLHREECTLQDLSQKNPENESENERMCE